MVIRHRAASQASRYNRLLLVATSILFSLAGRTQPARAAATAASFPPETQSAPAQPLGHARTPAIPSPAAQRKQAAGTAAAAKTPPIKYFCYSTDAAQPAAYFSAIFDVPDAGGQADNFLRYGQVKIEFEQYLVGKYKYPAPPKDNDNVDCEHLSAGNDKPDAVTARMTSEKRSGETAVAAAKKPIVETGWKFTATAGASATDSARQRSASADAKKQLAVDDKTEGKKTADAASSSPALVWHMETKKDALTDAVTSQPSATKFFLTDPAFFITASAYCSSNGASVFFLAAAGAKDTPPEYSWYQNPDDDSEQIADVRMRVDDRSVHVAHGFENVDGHTAYVNWLGLLFYEPGVVARAAQEQADSASTGIAALDGLVGGLVRQQAQANSQQWAESSAGPLSDLVNARSIRVELPLVNQATLPVVDLNPQDKVLHEFVQTCNARFVGGRQ